MILYRPIGTKELELVQESRYTRKRDVPIGYSNEGFQRKINLT